MDALTKWSVTATKAKARLTFKQLALVALACVGGLAASGYGYYWWTNGRFIETTDDAYVQADYTIVAPKISGYISEVMVADNQPVYGVSLPCVFDIDRARDIAAAEEAARRQRETSEP